MKAKALEIRWHDTQPIFSADFHAFVPEQHKKVSHPYAAASSAAGGSSAGGTTGGGGNGLDSSSERDKMWRLATAGGDRLVRLWLVHPRPPPTPTPLIISSAPSSSSKPPPSSNALDPGPKVEYLATLKQHTGVVNCVRFSPVGETLASAGDDGNILFWVPGESTQFGDTAEDKAFEKEAWRVRNMLRNSTGQEIYDIAWSPDGAHILAGSVDHTANIYDVSNGTLLHTIAEHTNYVQGVAWDPINHFIATQSSDRSMHVYSLAHSSTGAMQVHPVGKTSRLDVQHQSGGTWRPGGSSNNLNQSLIEDKDQEKDKGKGKDVLGATSSSSSTPSIAATNLPKPTFHRTISQRSDSEISDLSTPASIARFPLDTSLPSPSTTMDIEESFSSMDPPANPRPSSRRSSTSGSHPGHQSPALSATSASKLHFRSPSPAPLPAVKVPLSPKLAPASTSSSGDKSGASGSGGKVDNFRLYGDANSTPFFRRLCWSIDGSLLLTPAGLFEDPYAGIGRLPTGSSAEDKKKKQEQDGAGSTHQPQKPRKNPKPVGLNAAGQDKAAKPTVYIYSRSNVARPPIAHLPGHKTTSIAIRFCPIYWELREGGNSKEEDEAALEKIEEEDDDILIVELGPTGVEVPLPGSGKDKEKKKEKEKEKEDDGVPTSLFDLPYRMVYAVATLDAVFLYDTQQAGPICMFGNLHYAPFTDLSWSADGQTLVVSSQDGYCSIIAFDPLELGTPYKGVVQPPPAILPQFQQQPSAGTIEAAFKKVVPEKRKAENSLPTPVTVEEKKTTSAGGSAAEAGGSAGAVADGGADEAAKKKKKKVPLTFVGPIGGS